MNQRDPINGGHFLLAGDPVITDKYQLAGTVAVDGLPAADQMVTVLDRRNMATVAATGSRADGTWHITGIPYGDAASLLVIACNDSGHYNAEAADLVTAVELV